MKKKILWGIVIVVGILFLFFLIGLWQERREDRLSYGRRSTGFADSAIGGLSLSRSSALSSGLSKSFEAAPPSLEAVSAPVVTGGGERLIIKTGNVSMVVDDMATAIRSIRTFVQQKDGWVVSSDLETVEERPVATMTVRIPAKLFDESLTAIRGFAKKVTKEYIRGEDVTEEYVDLGAQLKSLEAVEAQFTKILDQAVKIEEILSVQRELQRVRSEIDRLKGRMQYLEKNAQMATLTIHLALDEASLPVIEEQQWRPWVETKNAVRSLLESLKGLANLVIWLIVYAVIWVPAFFLGRFVYRRWKRHKTSNVS